MRQLQDRIGNQFLELVGKPEGGQQGGGQNQARDADVTPQAMLLLVEGGDEFDRADLLATLGDRPKQMQVGGRELMLRRE